MPWRWPWYRERAASQAARSRHTLREFVYLDEVSVYSLLASRSGPVPTEFTETESASLQDELTGSVSVGVPGLGSELGGASRAATASSSQIVRKSSAQARFKQFVEAEQGEFVFSTGDPVATTDAGASIHRGRLFEMQVELEADETFQLSTTIASLVEFMNEDSSPLWAYIDRSEVEQALALNLILERLLVGLVPIRARAVDYVALNDGAATRVVHRSLLDEHSPAGSESAEPLYVVGFTQQELFWKDPRAVLFGGHRHVLTGRLAGNGVQERWSPVKLAEVLRSFLPEVADQLDDLGRGFGSAMRASTSKAEQPPADASMRDALVDFALRVVSPRPNDDEVRALLEAWEHSADGAFFEGSLEQTRAAFASAVRLLGERFGEAHIDRDLVARHRSDVIVEHGLPPAPALPRQATDASPDPDRQRDGGRYLEAEIIALYW